MYSYETESILSLLLAEKKHLGSTTHIDTSLTYCQSKFYGQYGDLIKHYEVPLSQMLHDILGHNHIQWHPPLIKHFTKSWACYRTGSYYRFWRYYLILGAFHRTFATGAASLYRTLNPRDTWSYPILVLVFVLMLRLFIRELVMSTDLFTDIPRYFYFAW